MFTILLIPGIQQKLSYLEELGVTAVWLSPIYKSPMVDAGYDIADFKSIAPEFGTMADFDNLLKETHNLGMKLIMDFVPNHSSDKHEWFVKGSNPDDPEYEKYKDYYVWHDAAEDGSPPNNWRNIFGNGIDGDAWEWNDKVGQYYLHQFHAKQPDLNYRNSDLVQEMKDVLKFWLDKGVDGFRVDAIQRLVEDAQFRNNTYGTDDRVQDQPETIDMIQQWRELLDTYSDKFMMLEVYASTNVTMEYFGTADRPAGNFPFNTFILSNLNYHNFNADSLNRLIHEWIDNVPSFGWNNWLIGNHDNNRIASRLGTSAIDIMNTVVLLLPGTAITYNGEEIGMTDNDDITYAEGQDPQGCAAGEQNFKGRSRDFERSPMQWDDSNNAGFSTSNSTWLPVNKNYITVNVKTEQQDGKSHLNFYKKLVKARVDPVIQQGNVETFVVDTHVLGFMRLLDKKAYVVVLNLGNEAVTVNLYQKYNIPTNVVTVYTSRNTHYSDDEDLQLSRIVLEANGSIILTNSFI